MKSTVEHLGPTRVKLSIEVGFDELAPNFEQAYKELGGQVRVPGFRPGKVPAKIIDARLGRGAVLTEVVNKAVPAKYSEAVQQEQLKTLGQPEVEIEKLEDGEVLSFTAEVDVRPDLVLPDLTEIEVTVDDLEVTDDDVDSELEALRERFATKTTVDRAAADGDVVTVNIAASLDGETLPEAASEGLSYTVGGEELIDGIDGAVIGLKAGETGTFTSTLVAGKHAGKDAEVQVTVTAVAERALPEVDDDFAQLASEFDTVAELRENLVEQVTRVKNLRRASDARDKIMEHLLDTMDIPVPDGARQAEVETRQHDAVHAFNHDEAALLEHLESIGQTKEELDAEIEQSADDAVRAQLLLDALAEEIGVTVTQQEFTERLVYNAGRAGMPPQDYMQRLQETGQIGGIFAEVQRAKALMGAVQRAKISSLSGEKLAFEDLFGIEIEAQDEAPTASAAKTLTPAQIAAQAVRAAEAAKASE